MLRIFFEVLNNGRGENVQESFASSYSEKILVQDKLPILGPLWAANDSSELLFCLKDFRSIVDKERGREVYRKIYIEKVFPKELLFGVNGSFSVQFGPKMTHYCNCG